MINKKRLKSKFEKTKKYYLPWFKRRLGELDVDGDDVFDNKLDEEEDEVDDDEWGEGVVTKYGPELALVDVLFIWLGTPIE